MKKNNVLDNGIPVSVSLNAAFEAENFKPQIEQDKKRLFFISVAAFLIAIVISFTARLLVSLIDLFTNISFFHRFSFAHASPATNTLGLAVIAVPVIGGLIVGIMALYGSKAIRGHGIPEAMEQILTNQSKIKPSITYLKPISAAISIGTGGPFGAEGPIIATGGAFGSTVGQLIKISNQERKVLLAAGATAGMSAIFGTPVAAIFLAVELLLFEFSPRSLIPVSVACITGAAGHHFLFAQGPVFPMPQIAFPGNEALAMYSFIGLLIGLFSALVTKAVYWIEDSFEKIPVHWMWWPAFGGLAVGLVGYFSPRTLGVGYENITDILSGTMTLRVVCFLCFLKFISWAIALGSGTSGGTLAPLLTIGGAAGILLGMAVLYFFPGSGLVLPLAALAGMSAMFAGASRALLTSVVFAVESTAQPNAFLPLLGACIASYFVSFFLMKNTIMTEKIARRGIKTPVSYEPDLLGKINVSEVTQEDEMLLTEENSIGEVRQWLRETAIARENFVVVNSDGIFRGIVRASSLHDKNRKENELLASIISDGMNCRISADSSLRTAVEKMAQENTDVLAVYSPGNTNEISGVITTKEVIGVYKTSWEDHQKKERHISFRRGRLKMLIRGKKFIANTKDQS